MIMPLSGHPAFDHATHDLADIEVIHGAVIDKNFIIIDSTPRYPDCLINTIERPSDVASEHRL